MTILKLYIIIIFISIVFIIFGVRLFYLQIFSIDYFQRLSFNNNISIKNIPYLRGKIFSSDGEIIANNVADYKIYFKPDFRLSRRVIDIFEKELDLDFSTANSYFELKNMIVNRILKIEDIDNLIKYGHELKNIDIRPVYHRYYPYNNLASHIIGYTRFRAEYIENINRYELTEYGTTGIENRMNTILDGINGVECSIVDALGRHHKTIQTKWTRAAVNGNDIVLTLNAKVQKFIEENYPDDINGAVVVMNVNTGDIIALASFPNYDINKFVFNDRSINQILSSKKNILLNRAVQGVYPIGSVMKIFSAVSYIESGGDTDAVFTCRGEFRLGDRTFKCWKEEGHGRLNLKDGFKHSCNVYFYNLALQTGYKNIIETLELFNINKRTNINIPFEQNPIIPKKNAKKVPRGDILNISIGQGGVAVTPISLAVAVAAIANGGYIVQPNIIKDIYLMYEKEKQQYINKSKNKIDVNQETLDYIKEIMFEAVETGTGRSALFTGRRRNVPFKIGGKTGTAQVVPSDYHEEIKPHSWFTAFFPEVPEYVIVTIMENAGFGGSHAAPFSGKLIRYMADVMK
jgi:penicillin-binding protein 2